MTKTPPGRVGNGNLLGRIMGPTCFVDSPPVDQVGVEERISRLTKRSIKKASKLSALKLAMSMLDLTTLEARDTPGKVRQLCTKAMHPHVAVLIILSAVRGLEFWQRHKKNMNITDLENDMVTHLLNGLTK